MKNNTGIAVLLIAVMSYAFYLQTRGKLIPGLSALLGLSASTGSNTGTSGMPSLNQIQPLSPIQVPTGSGGFSWKLPAVPLNAGTPNAPSMPSFGSGTMTYGQ